MIEQRRDPRRGGMTIVAGVIAENMRRRLADGGDTVMARAARTQYLGMINKIRRLPQGGVVAVLAHRRGGDVIDTLAGGTDAVMAGLVDSIIDMAQRLELRTIAEGVETREQAEYLRERGVDYAQGWFYCRGVPAAEFIYFAETFNSSSGG